MYLSAGKLECLRLCYEACQPPLRGVVYLQSKITRERYGDFFAVRPGEMAAFDHWWAYSLYVATHVDHPPPYLAIYDKGTGGPFYKVLRPDASYQPPEPWLELASEHFNVGLAREPIKIGALLEHNRKLSLATVLAGLPWHQCMLIYLERRYPWACVPDDGLHNARMDRLASLLLAYVSLVEEEATDEERRRLSPENRVLLDQTNVLQTHLLHVCAYKTLAHDAPNAFLLPFVDLDHPNATDATAEVRAQLKPYLEKNLPFVAFFILYGVKHYRLGVWNFRGRAAGQNTLEIYDPIGPKGYADETNAARNYLFNALRRNDLSGYMPAFSVVPFHAELRQYGNADCGPASAAMLCEVLRTFNEETRSYGTLAETVKKLDQRGSTMEYLQAIHYGSFPTFFSARGYFDVVLPRECRLFIRRALGIRDAPDA